MSDTKLKNEMQIKNCQNVRTKTEMTSHLDLITKLRETHHLTYPEFRTLMETEKKEVVDDLKSQARAVADSFYGKRVFIRGLIEFTNYCKNDCLYCGIRKSNHCAERYRLTKEEILDCCAIGYDLGFRTFVLQGGEDSYYTDERICTLVSEIKAKYGDCAVTLSIGEKSEESYRAFFEAGADRYLLRHETADKNHYEKLHPSDLVWENRIACLHSLKKIGYQTGCGFMVGSPYQTMERLYKDLCFIEEFQPHMVGIGPFIPQKDTPFGKEAAGTLDMTLRLLAMIRLICPSVLLPATTALGTIAPMGRELGIQAGANVVMPNLSPLGVRKKYSLYDNKICMGDEAAESRYHLADSMAKIGYEVVVSRGDYGSF